MKSWFECRIRYTKMLENGMNKRVIEPYLVDALSFTEAEARIIEEMTPFIDGGFVVTDIKRAIYNDVVFSDEDNSGYWFRCKITIVTLDEKSGTEKKVSMNILVQASYLDKAKNMLDDWMKVSMSDYLVNSVVETSIVDVFVRTGN